MCLLRVVFWAENNLKWLHLVAQLDIYKTNYTVNGEDVIALKVGANWYFILI